MVKAARSYHHGDLRSALVAAGLRLARHGGVSAVALREATRTVGVSPNAAYRHFADREALVLAVAVEAQHRLARSMLDRMNDIDPDAEPARRALERLRAVGLGYIEFARSEPGWFELAFLTHDEAPDGGALVSAGDSVPPPFQLLLDALDELVDAHVLTPERRVNAEWACWSTVHGFADLVTRGPLQTQSPAAVSQLAAHVVSTIIDGLPA
jgi:AcrR family transcriptional regulator